MRRSILVLLNFVLPLFCISFVSGPRKEAEVLGKPNNPCASGLPLGFPDSGHQGGTRPRLEERFGFRAGELLPPRAAPAHAASSHVPADTTAEAKPYSSFSGPQEAHLRR